MTKGGATTESIRSSSLVSLALLWLLVGRAGATRRLPAAWWVAPGT